MADERILTVLRQSLAGKYEVQGMLLVSMIMASILWRMERSRRPVNACPRDRRSPTLAAVFHSVSDRRGLLPLG